MGRQLHVSHAAGARWYPYSLLLFVMAWSFFIGWSKVNSCQRLFQKAFLLNLVTSDVKRGQNLEAEARTIEVETEAKNNCEKSTK